MYITALVTIHMAVLGLANLVRVAAESALGLPGSAFLGLPFVFAENVGDQRRRHLSLALALVLIGVPAWYFHWRAGRRAAERDPLVRASAPRAVYAELVIFVTALLVFFHGQFVLSRILEVIIDPPRGSFPPGITPPQFDPLPLAVGPLAMVLVAAPACWLHLRWALADRRAVEVRGTAAALRRARTYGLAFVGGFSLLFGTQFLLNALWDLVFFPRPPVRPSAPSWFVPDSAQDILERTAVFVLPTIVTGAALLALVARSANRVIDGTGHEATEERRSATRRFTLYGFAFFSAIDVLVMLSLALHGLVRQLLGDPDPGGGRPLLAAAGSPLTHVAVFGTAWVLARRAIARDASRLPEREAQADVRRLYHYLIALLTLPMIGFGTAGLLGIVGSYAMSFVTHDTGEIALYATLVIVGVPFWAYHWWRIQREIWTGDAESAMRERRARARRLYLYAAVLGGALATLVFGSAALFRMLNAGFEALGSSVPFWQSTIHDIQHFVIDTVVAFALALWHWRVLRTDRAAERTFVPAAAPAAPSLFAFQVLITGDDVAAARARLEAVLGGAGVVAEGASAER